MDLALAQMDVILANFARKCGRCEIHMQPLSTKCTRCGNVEPFTKVFDNSYFEHIILLQCEVHKEQTYHCCIHPAVDSKLEDLKTWCIRCIMDYVASHGGIEVTKTS